MPMRWQMVSLQKKLFRTSLNDSTRMSIDWVKKPYIYYYTVYVALSHYIWIQIHAHFNFKIFFIICILSGMKEGKFYCNFMYG